MKKIFALPGILLPITILAIGAFIGNSAFDIKMHNSFYNVLSVNLLNTKFSIPLFISWIFHIVLKYIKQPPKKWAWLQVGSSIICVYIFYFSLNYSFPSDNIDHGHAWIHSSYIAKKLSILMSVAIFYMIQIVFWVYGLMALVKSARPKEDDIE